MAPGLARALMHQARRLTECPQENMAVTFEQDLMVASQTKNQTVVLAHGRAAKIAEQAHAEARIVNATIDAEIAAYGFISSELGLGGSKNDLVEYMWWQSVESKGPRSNTAFMVGVDQAVYIPGSGRPVAPP